MDKSLMTQAMKASISEVLEQMFFLPIDFFSLIPGGIDQYINGETVATRLEFSGAHIGTFWLSMPIFLARSVSADFLGSTPEKLSIDQVFGTALEMINMLAGSTLSHYDHAAVFDLSIPDLPPSNRFFEACTTADQNQMIIGIQTLQSHMLFFLNCD